MVFERRQPRTLPVINPFWLQNRLSRVLFSLPQGAPGPQERAADITPTCFCFLFWGAGPSKPASGPSPSNNLPRKPGAVHDVGDEEDLDVVEHIALQSARRLQRFARVRAERLEHFRGERICTTSASQIVLSAASFHPDPAGTRRSRWSLDYLEMSCV